MLIKLAKPNDFFEVSLSISTKHPHWAYIMSAIKHDRAQPTQTKPGLIVTTDRFEGKKYKLYVSWVDDSTTAFDVYELRKRNR